MVDGEQEAVANALRGIPRDALVLIDTPDGPKRLRMVAGRPSHLIGWKTANLGNVRVDTVSRL